MRIGKLEVKGFGKLNNLDLAFSKGLNIVFGKNESGKSSVQWFIKGMFFGLKGGKSSRDGIPTPIKKFKPWMGNDFSGFMEYELDDGEIYRIGRNFNNNTVKIFDSLFNDITASFDASKEKGVAFYEKHLGLNDACFDRTVFIRQMESIIDEDGSRELLNRLINVSQTGFEDVSFKKAQEALKEALKNYVGTDKTTTRPLDKIVNRLEELKAIKNQLVSKRDSMFSIEEYLNKSVALKSSLENKKNIMMELRDFISLKASICNLRKLINDINDILENIVKDEEELKLVLNKMADFNKIKDEFGKFASYDNDDIDKLERSYHKLLNLKDETEKLKSEVSKKQENLHRLKNSVSSNKVFENLDTDIEKKVEKLNYDLDYLKKEYNKEKAGAINVNTYDDRKKEKLYVAASIVSFILTFLGVGLIYILPIAGIPLSITAAFITIAFIILKNGERKKSTKTGRDKNTLFKNIDSLSEDIKKKEKELRDIYSFVEADSLQAFLMKKADYVNKTQQETELNKDLSRMENVIELNNQRIVELKKSISDKLMEADLKLGDSYEINDKGISEFKYGIRRYKGNEPSILYTEQRIEDLKKGFQKYYKNISVLSGRECNGKEDVKAVVGSLDEEYSSLELKFNNCNKEITVLIDKEEYLRNYIPHHSEKYIEENLDEIGSIIDNENNRIDEELKKVTLDIKEYETELKYQPDNEEEMHNMDGELENLSIRKNYLEDTNISLKTALDVLTEASMEIQRDFVPALNLKMSNIISRISEGRYSDLRADDKLTLKTISPETGDVVNAALLSGGTTDQMYLALRVAMSEILTGQKESLPLIMDEVFSQYDDDRTRETFKFLNSLIEDRQIIVFTCKSREVEIAKEIFCEKLNLIEI